MRLATLRFLLLVLVLLNGMFGIEALAQKPEPIVFTPKDQKGEVPVAVWLHGYRGFPGVLKESYFQEFADALGIAIVGFPGTTDLGDQTQQWSEEPAADHAYIQERLAVLGRNHRLDTNRVGLFGFSQGAMVAAELCSRFPEYYQGGIIMSPGGFTLPSSAAIPLPGHKRQRFWLLCGAGEEAGNVALTKAYTDQLKRLGAEVTQILYPGIKEHTRPPDFRENFPNWMTKILRLEEKADSSPGEPAEFPLLGLWRAEEIASIEGKLVKPQGEAEFDFRDKGVLFVTMFDPQRGVETPIRLRFTYTFHPPDVVAYTLDGSAHERQQFSVSNDILHFKHLDYKRSLTFRRIQTTQFNVPPEDVKMFPSKRDLEKTKPSKAKAKAKRKN